MVLDNANKFLIVFKNQYISYQSKNVLIFYDLSRNSFKYDESNWNFSSSCVEVAFALVTNN